MENALKGNKSKIEQIKECIGKMSQAIECKIPEDLLGKGGITE
jgi:hypothetical protein